jgi:sortase A
MIHLNYPVFGTLYNQIHEGKVIESYDHTIHTIDKERRKKYLEEAQAYNIMLAKENPQLSDAFSQEAKKSDSAYNRVLNMEESGFNRASGIAECRTFFKFRSVGKR